MPSKYQSITNLYESTIINATTDAGEWTSFLRSACRNYKLRFDEQMLVYAQRPDATAVLEIEHWNKRFGRWVNKGAKGIAVFDDEHNNGYRLKHYFDIADTHGSRFERPVPIWDMKPDYEAEVIESLENSFGDLDDKSSLAAAIISAASNAVEDNKDDYLSELATMLQGSGLESLSEESVAQTYRLVLETSAAYMLLTRCGLNADEYCNMVDFEFLQYFNTRSTINALGLAVSDISELCLREISATVTNLQRQGQNRTFAKPVSDVHNDNNLKNIQANERSFEDDERTDIPDGERLSNPEPDRAGSQPSSPWQIRVNPKEIPTAASESAVPEPTDGGNIDRTPDGDRTDSADTVGEDSPADGDTGERDGGIEGQRPDEMGGLDEQHSPERGGSDIERPDLHIKTLPTQGQQLRTMF